MKWEPAGKNAPGGKRGKKNRLLIAVAVIAVIAIFGRIASCGGGGGGGNATEKLEWPTTGLATVLPKPNSDKGEVVIDNDDMFDANIDGWAKSDYDAYVEQCKERGFTIEASDGGSTYEAFLDDGHHLRLMFYDGMGQMDITLEAPIELGTITWPTAGAAALVPAPTSTTGKINSDSSTHFSASVGETGPEAYSSYVEACIAAGFNVDYNRGDDSFTADNAAGAHVSVRYEGFSVMSVSVDAPEASAEQAEQPVETPAEPEAPAPTDGAPAAPSETTAETTGTTSDFRAMVDEYEAFMNSYCDFMETYSSDSGNVVSMAIDYASMMAQYGDWATKIDAVDESALSAEDNQYFIDAQTRINQRLWSIGLSE